MLKGIETRINALLRITASTWGATFTRARQIYSAVVRPALAYGSAVWHQPPQAREGQGRPARGPTGPAAKLTKVQNKYLRVITGVYRATPTAVLETEAYIPPLDLFLDAKLARFRRRHKQIGMEELVSAAYARIQNKLGWRRRRNRPVNEGEKRTR